MGRVTTLPQEVEDELVRLEKQGLIEVVPLDENLKPIKAGKTKKKAKKAGSAGTNSSRGVGKTWPK